MSRSRKEHFRFLKLDIHGETVPGYLERLASHHSNFQPIHLGGSFMEAPCKPHNRSLQSSRTTVLTPTPAFKMGSPPLFPKRASLPLSHFVVFAFVREHRSLLQDRISALWPSALDENPII
ncbi:hypothetical protein AVEN_242693-1 [Araneus ventricosus]|uniref:Uncharacterized protein n=1 Tax=Araneus ventricosus TaxID=182803 RepID=A0A4Y2DYR9_ARAVE|nr:hypothetical protein AVEN_242693-1 [Araneus ventricosus]